MKRPAFSPVVLVAILAVALAGLAVVASHHAASVAATGGKAFPALAAHLAEAARIDIVTPSATYALTKQGEGWVLPGKADYPADAQRVASFLATLGDMDLLEQKTADPARYSQLTLADPAASGGAGKTVKVTNAAGQVLADATFGKSAPSLGRLGGGIYLRRAGEARTWLAEGLPVIPESADRWADRDLFGVADDSTIKSAAILDAAGKTLLTAARAKPDDKDFTVRPALPGKPDTAKIDQLAETPVSLDFDDVEARPADAKPTRSIVFKRFDGGSYTVTLYAIGKETWTGASETGAGADAFNALHGRYLFKLPGYRMPVLQADPLDLVVHNDPDATGAAHPVKHP
jgi:hypothetical protein